MPSKSVTPLTLLTTQVAGEPHQSRERVCRGLPCSVGARNMQGWGGVLVVPYDAAKGGQIMKQVNRALTCAGALGALLALGPAEAASNKVVIGDIDDMSGPYADVIGAGGLEALKMAVADFGGTVLGQPIEVLSADHQNKPDIAVQNSANGPIRTV